MKSKFIIGVLAFFTVLSCSSSDVSKARVNKILEKLNDHEAKIEVLIDGKDFYPETSVFQGELTVFNSFFRVSLFDQYRSNVVLAFGGEHWYKEKPIEKTVFKDNQINASVMIGRIKDEKKNLGEGYLMTEGHIKVISLNKERAVISLTGKVGLYQMQNEPTQWNTLKALIVIKKPLFKMQDVKETDLFYQQ
jgi:hypothetical protein